MQRRSVATCLHQFCESLLRISLALQLSIADAHDKEIVEIVLGLVAERLQGFDGVLVVVGHKITHPQEISGLETVGEGLQDAPEGQYGLGESKLVVIGEPEIKVNSHFL